MYNLYPQEWPKFLQRADTIILGISEAMANLKNIFPKSTFFDNQRRKKLLYFSRENFLLALTFLENVEIDADYMTL